MEAEFREVFIMALWIVSLKKAGSKEDYRENPVLVSLWNMAALGLTAAAFIVLVKWFTPPLV